MKLIYFSLDYTPHDHRFLSVLSESEHRVYYVRLQRGARQTESRPVPENIETVPWAGGQKPFAWRDLPRLALDFRRVVQKIRPDFLDHTPKVERQTRQVAPGEGFLPARPRDGFDILRHGAAFGLTRAALQADIIYAMLTLRKHGEEAVVVGGVVEGKINEFHGI